jgi:hypothetical protein
VFDAAIPAVVAPPPTVPERTAIETATTASSADGSGSATAPADVTGKKKRTNSRGKTTGTSVRPDAKPSGETFDPNDVVGN